MLREALYAGAVATFAYYFSLRHLLTPQWAPAGFAQLVNGTAFAPMQYRALVPWAIRGLRALDLPVLRGWKLDEYRLALDLISTAAVVYSTRWLLGRVGFSSRAAMLGSWLVPLMLPFVFLIPPITRYYPYDLPAIAFFALCLGLMMDRRWVAFYPLFAVATLNRETTCFLTIAFVLASIGRQRLSSVFRHVAAQAVIWASIKLLLLEIYKSNNNPAYRLHLDLYRDRIPDNLDVLGDPFGATLFSILSVVVFAWVPLFVLRARIRHPFIERAIWVIPIYVGAMFYVGEMAELRIYGELLPLVAAAGLLIFSNELRAT